MPRLIVPASLITLLLACASENGTRVEPAGEVLPAGQAVVEQAAVPVEYGSFTSEQLFQAIAAELSAQRGDIERAAEIYFDLASETRDAGIVERAVRFASALGGGRRLLELGLLWAQVEPDLPDPHMLLAFQLLEAGRPAQALSHMEQVLEAGGRFDFSILASVADRVDRSERDALIAELRSLKERYPQRRTMRIALVQLLAQNGEFEAALAEFEEIDGAASTPNLVRLQAQLHSSAGSEADALETLRAGVERFSEDRELRMSYARALLLRGDLESAREQFAIMLAQAPNDWDSLFRLGLIDLEMEDFESAIEVFEQFLAAGQNEDDSHYYLGFARLQLGDAAAAIEHFRQVRQGVENFLPAQQQATRLSIQLGQFEEAHDWLAQLSRGSSRLEVQFVAMESTILLQEGHLDRARELLDMALNRYPNHADLLFSRVFVHDAAGDMASLEADLRQIIRMQPDNATALNDLGFMLADRSDRYEEALQLIERAIAIAPDNPAIIDSLGWAQYKLGMLDEALVNLRRAYADFPNHEVAAHLGEVLWMLDRRDEAERIWEQALENNPESEYVLPTMERLKGRR